MTSRDRIQNAVNFLPPDRPPVNIDMSLFAYRALLEHLNRPLDNITWPNTAMEVLPDPEVLSEIGIDVISVKPNTPRYMRSGILDELPETLTDGWGITRRLTPQANGAYYEIVDHPLAGAELRDLDRYSWPICDPSDTNEDLRRRAANLHDTTDLALMGRFGGPVIEIAFALLGMEEWYVRLVNDRIFIQDLLDRIADICAAMDLQGINSCGEYLQIMKVSGEDLGMQSGLLYAPRMIRDILLPPLERRWRMVRRRLAEVNPKAKIMLHSCGAIGEIIPDLINSGIDILDPVQPNAAGMDPLILKPAFGNRIVFHGGIDIQRLLPFGTPEEVKRTTAKILEGFRAEEGGFIAAPSHCVQPDVPPQNLLAMIEAAKNHRQCP